MEFENSAFARLNEEHALTPPSPKDLLDGPIHPIFAFKKFCNLRKVEYDNLLALPLRLATQFTTLDTFAEFVVTMADGDIYKSSANGSRRTSKKAPWHRERHCHDQKCCPFRELKLRFPQPGMEKPCPQMRRRAAEILDRLGTITDISISECKSDKARGWVSRGRLLRPDQPISALPKATHRATLHISASFLDRLDNLWGWGWQSKYSLEYMHTIVDMAETFIHELAHVLIKATEATYRRYEPFYKNSALSEAGFQLQSRLMGGFPTETEYESEGMRCLVPWPCWPVVHFYRKDNFNTIDIRGSPKGDWRFMVCRVLPDAIRQDLLTKKFWAEKAPKLGMSALLPRDLPRWVFYWNWETEQLEPCSMTNPNLPSDMARKLHCIIRREGRMETEDWIDIWEEYREGDQQKDETPRDEQQDDGQRESSGRKILERTKAKLLGCFSSL